MVSKFTKRTRIKLYWRKLSSCKKIIDIPNDMGWSDFFTAFQKETGLHQTSAKFNYKQGESLYYFKIVDKQKFSLAKLKYEI